MSNLQSLEQRMDRHDYQVISDDKDKRIADLEAKLAESEKNVEFYQERCANLSTSAYGADLIAKNIQSRLEEEIRELKQQLAEKEKEIESLRENSLSKRIFKEKLIPSHCMKQYEKYEQQIDKLMQDKISFCIEQLEKVKETLLENLYDLYSKPSEIWEKYGDLYDVVITGGINKTFDNQIKAIKEME